MSRGSTSRTFVEKYKVVGTVSPYVDADLDHVAGRRVHVSLSAGVCSATHLDAVCGRLSVRQHGVTDPARLGRRRWHRAHHPRTSRYRRPPCRRRQSRQSNLSYNAIFTLDRRAGCMQSVDAGQSVVDDGLHVDRKIRLVWRWHNVPERLPSWTQEISAGLILRQKGINPMCLIIH